MTFKQTLRRNGYFLYKGLESFAEHMKELREYVEKDDNVRKYTFSEFWEDTKAHARRNLHYLHRGLKGLNNRLKEIQDELEKA